MFDAINGMMLDMLAAVARKDYADRRRRQMQGSAREQQAQYQDRCLLRSGASSSAVQEATGCSRATVAKIAKRTKAAA